MKRMLPGIQPGVRSYIPTYRSFTRKCRNVRPDPLEEVGLQVCGGRKVGQADRLGGAASEGRAWSEPYELGALDRHATAHGFRADRIVGTRDGGAPVVEEVHRDLDEPAALEGQAEGLDTWQASRGLAHCARDVPRRVEITRVQPDVVRDEDVACADGDGAASRVEFRRATVGAPRGIGQSDGQALVFAAPDISNRPTLGSSGRGAVEIDGHAVLPAEPLAHASRDG